MIFRELLSMSLQDAGDLAANWSWGNEVLSAPQDIV